MPEPETSKRDRRIMAKERRRGEQRSASRRRLMVRLIVVAVVSAGIATAVFFAIDQGAPETVEVAAAVSERYRVDDEGRNHVDEGRADQLSAHSALVGSALRKTRRIWRLCE